MLENNSKISKKNNKNIYSKENNNLKEEKEHKTGIVKQEISRFLAMGDFFSPISKLSENNINQILENEDKHDERKFKDKREIRITAIIIIAVIMFIIFIFKDNIELLKDILIPIILSFFTAIGGYGFGYKKGRDADD